MKLKIKLHSDGYAPTRATDGSAAMDLRARGYHDLMPGARALIPCGIFVEIPPGYVGQVCPRSGHTLKLGVTVLNAPGLIDSDYRGEVGVILANFGHDSLMIMPGDRIAQLMITPVVTCDIVTVDELSETQRGAGGFGSTGVSNINQSS